MTYQHLLKGHQPVYAAHEFSILFNGPPLFRVGGSFQQALQMSGYKLSVEFVNSSVLYNNHCYNYKLFHK